MHSLPHLMGRASAKQSALAHSAKQSALDAASTMPSTRIKRESVIVPPLPTPASRLATSSRPRRSVFPPPSRGGE